jgi:hypothetical protein
VTRVVVIGPAHRVPLDGVGLSTAKSWSTPFGRTRVDQEAMAALKELPGVSEADGAHQSEHSIEVHLPFIREVLGDVSVVPLVVGRASIQLVGRVLQAVWGGDDTVIVASSDLSHYLQDAEARSRDRETAVAILEGRSGDIGPRDACGFLPVGGLLRAATANGLAPQLLGLSTSADATGETSRVVGYGSFSLGPPRPLDDSDRAWLLTAAARAIDVGVDPNAAESGDGGALSSPPHLPADMQVPDATRRPGASFVTLTRGENLLGCIGSLEPQRPLWQDVVHNARSAAFNDPRFGAISLQDLSGVEVEVSVLSRLEEIPDASLERLAERLRPGVDGLVIASEGHRATFLPDVWDKLTDTATFLSELARKAGWPSPWPPGARAWCYTTEVFTDRL